MYAPEHEYQGRSIKVLFDSRLCIRAAICIRRLPGVFTTGRRPWIDPDAADADEIARVVELCPSGALSYTRLDGGNDEQPPPGNTAWLIQDGPIHLRGDLHITDDSGRVRKATRAAVCRCGASSHPPFCDGSHADVGFSDDGMIRIGLHAKDEVLCSGQPLRLIARPRGPLAFAGPFSVVDARGRRLRLTHGALCRCGHSGHNPCCDGSHTRCGFECGG